MSGEKIFPVTISYIYRGPLYGFYIKVKRYESFDRDCLSFRCDNNQEQPHRCVS